MSDTYFQTLIALIGVSAAVVIFAGALAAREFLKIYRKRSELELALKEREFHSSYSEKRADSEMEIRRMQKELSDTIHEFRKVNHLLIDAQPSRSDEGFRQTDLYNTKRFLETLGISEQEISKKDNLIFVLTPFNKVNLPYFKAVTEAFSGTGFEVRRGDEVQIDGDILPFIIKQIISSRILIANVEGRNPNVMYELGIAHALGKPVFITNSVKDFEKSGVPFDLQNRQIILYDNRRTLKELLSSRIISHLARSS
tara:strand:+ start:569 stop:1333 length:765 start_codon:yes stop_codon:yes gene_type:complete